MSSQSHLTQADKRQVVKHNEYGEAAGCWKGR